MNFKNRIAAAMIIGAVLCLAPASTANTIPLSSKATVAAVNSNKHRSRKPRAQKRSEASGATAECRDGSLSYSAHRRGTCSHHGGVKRWF